MRAMESNAFEKAFSEFIDRQEYDEAQNALFEMVRISFQAGWKAAGGDPPPSQPVLQLITKKPKK